MEWWSTCGRSSRDPHPALGRRLAADDPAEVPLGRVLVRVVGASGVRKRALAWPDRFQDLRAVLGGLGAGRLRGERMSREKLRCLL